MNPDDIRAGKPEALAELREVLDVNGSEQMSMTGTGFIVTCQALLDLVERLQAPRPKPPEGWPQNPLEALCLFDHHRLFIEEAQVEALDHNHAAIEASRIVADLEAERDMWKLEAALWSHDRYVLLPKGWTHGLDGLHFEDETVFIRDGDLRVRMYDTDRRFDTWAEAMKAAEEAASKDKR